MSRSLRVLSLAAVLVVVSGLALARDDEPAKGKKADPPKASKPATYKVEKGPFRIDLTMKGTFETPATTEVSVHFEAYSMPMAPQTVLWAIEPGATVKKGDVLLKLDPERIDKLLRDIEADQRLAELSMQQLEVEVAALEKSTPLDIAAAERTKKQNEEDWKRFNEVDRPFAEESVKKSNKMSHEQLEYAQEELKQLEKMYRTKDLTEETEEIILRRQRNQVEYYTFIVKQADMRKDQFFAFELPRRIERFKDEYTRTNLAYDRAKIVMPMQLQKTQLGLEKAKYERARSAERLANLKADRELFTVKSPADGIVYYGRNSMGSFGSAAGLLGRMQKGGTVMADEVFMTIVQPRPLFVRATADEKEIPQIHVGAACKITPTALPDTKLEGKIEKASSAPIAPGTFEVRAGVDVGNAAVFPGMTCSMKLTPYLKSDAITAPNAYVFADDVDEDKMHVFVWRSDPGKFEKRSVTTGKKSGSKVEITAGLKAGDEIAMVKPDAKELMDR
jgi:multidrug efflux pump subunit AcrA (membrane-fusion protein)